MAKDNKEDRKSTRSFDLNKSGKRSFELDKKSTRSFDLQKEDEEAVVGAGKNTAQQVAESQSTKAPATSQTTGQHQKPNKHAASQPTSPPKEQAQKITTNKRSDSTGEDYNSGNGKKWIGAAIVVAAIAGAIWAFSGNGGNPAEETKESPQTTLVSDSTSNDESNETDPKNAENTEVMAEGSTSGTSSTTTDGNVSERQMSAGNTVLNVETENQKEDNSNAESATSSTSTSTVSGSVEEIVNEVLTGKYGNWPERERKLGKRYKEIQSKVNEMYRNGLVK